MPVKDYWLITSRTSSPSGVAKVLGSRLTTRNRVAAGENISSSTDVATAARFSAATRLYRSTYDPIQVSDPLNATSAAADSPRRET